jgi:hypothetical protein
LREAQIAWMISGSHVTVGRLDSLLPFDAGLLIDGVMEGVLPQDLNNIGPKNGSIFRIRCFRKGSSIAERAKPRTLCRTML